MQTFKNTLLLGLLFMGALSAFAQQDLIMYHMDAVPQHQYVNPASAPLARINIGLPLISSIYLRHENTMYNPFHMFEQTGSGMTLRTDHFLGKLRDRNNFGIDAAIDLFSVGLKVKDKHCISFAIRERIQARLILPQDMLAFPFTGNADFDEHPDGTLDFSDLRLHLNHYREYGIGWQTERNEKWNFGARLKLLYGMENIDTKNSSMKWNTNPESWDWTFTGEMDVYTSGIAVLADTLDHNSDLENEEIENYLLNRKNWGFGIDIGAEYKVNEKLTISASLTDIGYINWKTYNKHFLTDEGEFVYAGLEITENALGLDSAFQDTIDVVIDDLLADLEETFAIKEQTETYRSSIMARMHLAATYDLYENINTSGSANFLFQSEFYKGKLRPTFTLGYKQNVGKWLSANIAYSVIDRNFRNLGLGLSITGPVQFYIATDNVLAGVLNRMEIDDGASGGENLRFSYPSHARTMQFHTGINITLGKKPRDQDGDGVKDKKDVCPNTPGLAEFDGCPDSDGDGVQDSQDECPNTSGLIEFSGCPDNDGDGVPNRSDVCPETPGLPQFEGCPDTDSDGIRDKEDECPETAGLTEFAGCPDTDGDGVQDLNDNCPEIPGEKENRGCPWPDTDEDGLLDKDDGCPKLAGPAENNGCPYTDTDGDSVLDKDDGCVFTPGPVENNGCPVIEEVEQEILNTAFENLEFLSGNSVIKEESYQSLLGLAELLVKKPEWKLQISGHTDDVGEADTNMKLSENRSKAVASFIENKGVALDRIVVKWFGEDSPIADNTTTEGRQTNRRVEMEVVFD